VALADGAISDLVEPAMISGQFAGDQRFLRGLYSGGTLAYEAVLILQDYIPAVYSNVPLREGHHVLKNSLVSEQSSIVDLGEDEFTFGRLHPMMDNTFRIQRLRQEADDPEVAVILMDVVLGYGAHPNPASELAPAISEAISSAKNGGRRLEIVTVVVGTDDDPQGLNEQIKMLEEAGARVDTRNDLAVRYAGQLIQNLSQPAQRPSDFLSGQEIDLEMMKRPLAGINAGLESFAISLKTQGAEAIHVDWRPPASGNDKLAAILQRMKNRQS
jgi:FdrA protein